MPLDQVTVARLRLDGPAAEQVEVGGAAFDDLAAVAAAHRHGLEGHAVIVLPFRGRLPPLRQVGELEAGQAVLVPGRDEDAGVIGLLGRPIIEGQEAVVLAFRMGHGGQEGDLELVVLQQGGILDAHLLDDGLLDQGGGLVQQLVVAALPGAVLQDVEGIE